MARKTVQWLAPSMHQTIKRLADEGRKNVLVVPISFVSDHVETLHEIERQLTVLPTADIAGKAWHDYGEIIVVDSLEEAVAAADRLAFEHVEVRSLPCDALGRDGLH